MFKVIEENVIAKIVLVELFAETVAGGCIC